jgi:[ribosomal protein S5]-alanine N-acetyltransferase
VRNPFLIGTKVYLRPLECEDVGPLVAWFNDPEVTRFLLRYRPLTRMEEEAFLRKMSESDTDVVLGIAVRESDQFVGCTGLHQLDSRNRHASFGIGVGDKGAWGKGYGTEATRLMVHHAFDTLNLNRVWLRVYEYNERALGMYQKVGFRTEGRLRQDAFHEGRYWDTIVMAVLRDEWEAVD